MPNLPAFADYLYAIFKSFFGYLATGLLVIGLFPMLFGEKHWLSAKIQVLSTNRKWFLFGCLACFIYANFSAYNDARNQAQKNLVACLLTPASFAHLMSQLPTTLKGLKPGDAFNDGGIPAIVQP